MAAPMDYTRDLVPLRLVFQVGETETDTYQLKIPQSACLGGLVSGGITSGLLDQCALDFAKKNPKTSGQIHVCISSMRFLRPVLPLPVQATCRVREISVGKDLSTLCADLIQKDRLCATASVTIGLLTEEGGLSYDTKWALDPAPMPASTAAMATDTQPGWISYLAPYAPRSFRSLQSYFRFFVTEELADPKFIDQWVTPGWDDAELPGGPVWTNEMVPFVIDAYLPVFDNFLPPAEAVGRHGRVVEFAQVQRRARAEGKDDRIDGDGKIGGFFARWSPVTMALQTEFKKRLPDEGAKWLFMRVQCKNISHGRMDHEVIMLDEDGDLIALSHQIYRIYPTKLVRPQKASL